MKTPEQAQAELDLHVESVGALIEDYVRHHPGVTTRELMDHFNEPQPITTAHFSRAIGDLLFSKRVTWDAQQRFHPGRGAA